MESIAAFMVTAGPYLQAAGPYLQAASIAATATAAVVAADARAFRYEAQATQTRMQSETDKLKARQEAVAWRKSGTASLRKMRAVIAATKATAAAGNLQPLSGSTGALINESLAAGVDDYFDTVHNAIIALENISVIDSAARYQRGIYRRAAADARTSGVLSAGGKILEGGFRAYEAGAFRPATSSAPAWNPTYAGLYL